MRIVNLCVTHYPHWSTLMIFPLDFFGADAGGDPVGTASGLLANPIGGGGTLSGRLSII